MNNRVDGLLRGRPYGGVAVFVRRKYMHLFSLVNCEYEGRVICLRASSNQLNFLLIGCYFPFNDHTNLYEERVCSMVGFIESIVLNNPGSQICVVRDFNFECKNGQPGYDIFCDFATAHNVTSCDNMNVSDISHTYVNDSLHHTSFIDHIFISDSLVDCVSELAIISDGRNLSDHLPIGFHLKLPDSSFRAVEGKKNISIQFRWDKGDLVKYYQRSYNLLSKSSHGNLCAEHDHMCDDDNHRRDIEVYYNEIIHCLSVSADECIPRIPASALKHYWSETLDELKLNSKSTFDIWSACGRPFSGYLYSMMKDAKYKYKLAIRDAMRTYEARYNDDLCDYLLQKDMNSFWRTWSHKVCNKVTNVHTIDNKSCDSEIAEIFADKFKMISDVSCSDNHTWYDGYDMGTKDNALNVSWCYTSVEEIDRIVHERMKCGKSAGFDNLTLEHLLHCHPIVYVHLRNLFNLMIKHSYVPDAFGHGIVIPFLKDKNGDVCSSEN